MSTYASVELGIPGLSSGAGSLIDSLFSIVFTIQQYANSHDRASQNLGRYAKPETLLHKGGLNIEHGSKNVINANLDRPGGEAVSFAV